jgi:hypothetical protein
LLTLACYERLAELVTDDRFMGLVREIGEFAADLLMKTVTEQPRRGAVRIIARRGRRS